MAQAKTAPSGARRRAGKPAAKPAKAGPFLKWAGGKTQLLSAFASLYPGSCKRYIEPFVGSGAVFFHVNGQLQPRNAWLYDSNEELILAYKTIATDVEPIIRALQQHRTRHATLDRTYYNKIRAQDPRRLTPQARTARLIYLNKTCYNGLYRVNSRNQFNVPMGSYTSPAILDADTLRATSTALRSVRLQVADFRQATARARKDDFVYFDPPYDPISPTAYFTAYTQGRFVEQDQRDLADQYRVLAKRGCKVMLSNSDTPLIRQLYDGFDIHTVMARRTINARSDRRGPVKEVVVVNYKPGT